MPAQGMVGFDLAACPPSSKHRFLPLHSSSSTICIFRVKCS